MTNRFLLQLSAVAVAFALMGPLFFVGVMPARAASLTGAQIQSILALLQAFGAEQSVVAHVSATLYGTTQNGVTVQSTTVSAPSSSSSSASSASSTSASSTQTWSSPYSGNAYGGTTGSAFGQSGNGNIYGSTGTNAPAASLLPGATTPISLVASPSSGTAPLSVTFSAPALVHGANYRIDFGDNNFGDTSTTAFSNICVYTNDRTYSSGLVCKGSISHVYKNGGTYTAKVYGPSGMVLGSATVSVAYRF